MTGGPSAERDAAIEALVARSAADRDLWTVDALRRAAGSEADLLFSGGPPDMVEAWCDLADRRMLLQAEASGVAGRDRVGARVREAMLLRLPPEGERPAARRALAVLARPGETARATRVLAGTADAIWRAAGDRSTDLSRHTRRLTAGAVWSATLLYALGPNGADRDRVAAFLDRRLALVARIGRLRRGRG